jgi:acyl-CoA thioester hydrolase
MEKFKLKIPLVIRFADFDALGHVNNAKYLTYFEIARIKYFEEIITGGKVNWLEDGIIVARATIDFKYPLDGYDDYFISISCTRIGTKSLDFSYIIFLEKGTETIVIAEGVTVMVCYDYQKNESVPVRPEWRAAISLYEERQF